MRKVLSFVLVLALVMSSFSMAFAADSAAGLTDISGNANADAIQVAYDLGIVTGNPDGTYLPAKAVNRAEFAALITRALNVPDSALAGYTTTTFKDTVGYGWAVPYLAFCQSKGIMLGDGYGNAMPGRTITVNEAMTMALRAIGYTANSSLLVGAWPSNYVTLAQNYDLYDNVAAVTTVDKANAAQIIYNLLTVQKVAVNSDGTTDYLWNDRDDEVESNLLNTNLGCTEVKDAVIGDDYGYDNTLINITGKIGAFGTAYENDDEDLVAFIPDSTALTGKIDGGKFKVGDTKYEFDGVSSFTTDAATFVNTDYTATDEAINADAIVDFADANTDDGKTVTIYVDLSGKKIKDVYSIVAWSVAYDESDAALADSDVQDEITDDHELLGLSFVEDDNDDMDMKQFQLVGVTSLDKIAEDNVLYVYADKDENIRKVAVGTETVEGVVEETDEVDTVTIDGKDYDLSDVAVIAIEDVDVDAEGTFYLDVNGDIYDFDGSVGTDTFAIVKASMDENSFDNVKVKLYKSDDSTSTYYLADKLADIDWVDDVESTTIEAFKLIGYALDSDGDIDTVDYTATEAAVATFSSVKVLKTAAGSYDIDSSAVVFTYDADGGIDATGDYDVCTLADVEKGAFEDTIYFITNEDGKVAAMFISDADADTEGDAVYGVFNGRTKTTTDGDPVYKFTGYIDGAAFTYKTSDNSNADTQPEYTEIDETLFGVYAITLDASNQITKIEVLGFEADIDGSSAAMLEDAAVVDVLGFDNTVFTIGGEKYTVADDAVVYKYSTSDDEYTVSKLSSIDEGDTVMLYDTKGDDADGIGSVVIYIAN